MTACESGVLKPRKTPIASQRTLFFAVLADKMPIVTLLLRAQPAPSEMIWYVTRSALLLAAEAASPFGCGNEALHKRALD
jgi:hypothetical protein